MQSRRRVGDSIMSARDVQGDDQFRRDCILKQLAAVLSVVNADDMPDVSDLLVGWLDHNGAGSPDPCPFVPLRESATFWADIATPKELEAYVAAGLSRIERRNFAQVTLKRIFVSIWEVMSESDRRRFLSRVDPDGVFRKVGA